jgi:DNA-binding winged helix-turn-helix (wHTH) protein/TolB-like protein
MNLTRPSGVYRFGEYRLDANERELLRNGKPQPLTPKCFDLLVVLVENAGRLVAKDELISRVWPDSFVEETGLNRNIYLLRKALSDGGGARYIETVPKHGYRFIAEVAADFETDTVFIVEKHTDAEVVSEETTSSDWARADQLLTGRRESSGLRRYALPIIAASGALAIAVVGWLMVARSGRPVGGPPVKSIAVLPFRTIDANRESGREGLGLADILITRLSNIKELSVRPTSTVQQFEDVEQDSIQIGRELQVDAVLEGTIYHSNGRVRVTARLIRVSNQSPIWAGHFEQSLDDQLRMQDEIALQVVDSLALNLSDDEKSALARRYTESGDAYRLYIQGRYHWNKRDNEGLAESERLFRNAIEKDPRFALAYVGLADKWAFGNDPGEAANYVRRALELDPNLGEAYATRGFIYTFHGWDWTNAEADFKRSIELTPGYATAHQWYATLLMIRGRLDEAKTELNRALEINPKSYGLLTDLGQAHYFAREYDKAKEYCDKALSIKKDFLFAHGLLEGVYFQTGEYEKAIEEMTIQSNALSAMNLRSMRVEETNDLQDQIAPLLNAYHSGGARGFWLFQLKACLDNREKNPNRFIAVARAYLSLGEADKAIDYLERAHEERAFMLPFVAADPTYDSLRSEPRFQSLLHSMGLES